MGHWNNAGCAYIFLFHWFHVPETGYEIWVGLINPDLNRCENETCSNELSWDNDGAEAFVWEEFYTLGMKFDTVAECVRTSKKYEGLLDDFTCTSTYNYVCQCQQNP